MSRRTTFRRPGAPGAFSDDADDYYDDDEGTFTLWSSDKRLIFFFVLTSIGAVLIGLYQLHIFPYNNHQHQAVISGSSNHILHTAQDVTSTINPTSSKDDETCFNEADPIYQPKKVTRIGPATKVLGSLSRAEGTPWCNDNNNKGGSTTTTKRRTFWFVGHEFQEAGYCEVSEGVWERSKTVVLDDEDSKSVLSGWRFIDRHDCASIDANLDGIPDIVCVLGANRHKDVGWTELYLTEKNGTLTKIMDHGLQKYPTMSTRYTAKLNWAVDGSQLLFITTTGHRRPDGKTNEHRMFRLTGQKPDYFVELKGPWIGHFQITSHPLVGDFNMDGYDDLLTWTKAGLPPRMYLQTENGEFKETKLPNLPTLKFWRGVRWGYVTQSDRPDLVLTRGGFRDNYEFWVHVLEGIPQPPYFNFRKPYYTRKLPSVPFGMELLDVNRDGYKDIYITQRALDSDYCFGDVKIMQQKYYKGDAQPPIGWVPPIDRAQDLLFIGAKSEEKLTWHKVRMQHKMRGCADMVEVFGNEQTLALSGGTEPRAGYQYLLEW